MACFILIKLSDISSKWLFKSWNWKRGEKYFKFFHFSPFTVRQVLDTDGCSHASVFLTNESEITSTTLYFQRGKENCILSKIPEKFLFKVTKLLFVLVAIYKTLGPWACLKSLFLEDPRNHSICQQRLNVRKAMQISIPQLALIATIRQFLFSSIVCALNPFWDISDRGRGSKAAQVSC